MYYVYFPFKYGGCRWRILGSARAFDTRTLSACPFGSLLVWPSTHRYGHGCFAPSRTAAYCSAAFSHTAMAAASCKKATLLRFAPSLAPTNSMLPLSWICFGSSNGGRYESGATAAFFRLLEGQFRKYEAALPVDLRVRGLVSARYEHDGTALE